MPSSVITTQGVAWLAQIIARTDRSLGTPYVKVGTGKLALSPSRTALGTEYLLNGAEYRITPPVISNIVDPDNSNITGFRLRYFDTGLSEYEANEVGVFNDAGELVHYTIYADAEPTLNKGNPGGITFEIEVVLDPVSGASFTVETSIAGLGTATLTSIGGVQLSADGDTTSKGAKVVSPAQALAIAQGATTSLSFASSSDINTGTEAAEVISPLGLRGSRYPQLRYGTTDPTTAIRDAMGVGDIYVKRSTTPSV